MKNKIEDLRNHLFETIEKLKDKEITIEDARTISELAQVIVNSAKVEVDFIKTVKGKTCYFFPEDPPTIEKEPKKLFTAPTN